MGEHPAQAVKGRSCFIHRLLMLMQQGLESGAFQFFIIQRIELADDLAAFLIIEKAARHIVTVLQRAGGNEQEQIDRQRQGNE